MTAAIRAPHLPTPRPHVRLVEPGGAPSLPPDEPVGPPLRLLPGGREAVLRRRRPAAVYRRRRWASAVLAVLLVFGLLSGARVVEGWVLGPGTTSAASTATAAAASNGPAATAGASGAIPAGPTHLVQPGDTVWTIARSLQPEGDIRPLVDQLVERSGGGVLQVGQRLDLAGLTP